MGWQYYFLSELPTIRECTQWHFSPNSLVVLDACFGASDQASTFRSALFSTGASVVLAWNISEVHGGTITGWLFDQMLASNSIVPSPTPANRPLSLADALGTCPTFGTSANGDLTPPPLMFPPAPSANSFTALEPTISSATLNGTTLTLNGEFGVPGGTNTMVYANGSVATNVNVTASHLTCTVPGSLPSSFPVYAQVATSDGRTLNSNTVTVTSGYTVIALGAHVGDIGIVSHQINASGQVVGDSEDAKGNAYAILWQDGAPVFLRSLPGDSSSFTTGINDSGQIVGSSILADILTNIEFVYDHAVLWKNGATIALGSLPGGLSSDANGINASGQIVGDVEVASQPETTVLPVLWQNSTSPPIELGTLTTNVGYCSATAINASGQIIGWSGPGGPVAVFWQNSATPPTALSPTALGMLTGAGITSARGINSSGQIAGYSGPHAVLWQNGASPPLDLGTLHGDKFSEALGINGSGQIVGYSGDAGPGNYSGPTQAVLWKNGIIVNLNSLLPPNSGWNLTTADCINDAGQIAGEGSYQGKAQVFLLSPPASRRAYAVPRHK